jgi:ureidoacrylate peracid hydrolase
MGDDRIDKIFIEAEPEPVGIDFEKTAILVVDMQNAFVSRGGYFDAAGIDISAAKKIVHPCQKIIFAGRETGIKIVYLQMGYSQDLSDTRSPASPSFIKRKVPSLLKQRPELRDKLYLYGTWGAEIIEELKPRQGDVIIMKQRHDGFIETNLDHTLRTFGIKYLLFIGTATNICVESTLRHAFSLDYFSILVSDAVSQMGPRITHEATIFNVQSTFGWVTSSERLLRAMGNSTKGPSRVTADRRTE